jgi:hypothetical protein
MLIMARTHTLPVFSARKKEDFDQRRWYYCGKAGRGGVCSAIFLVLEMIHPEVRVPTPGHLQDFSSFFFF